ncbi:hypothetical protein CRM22_007038 [Opisthorchis felineus]|uniref:G-protein coupled receptors family 1 profile domain-containing protein n=1 Tax=Opisthorchis felineus TaxID=147828 RepID=A0A4S2LI00_OPIFE|nr:hypothetical protein CRM22_007038 [Opisthorchis felineus]
MNETDISNFPPYAKAIVGLLASCVSTATLGGNIVVLIAFFVESSLRIPSNYFIASLAATDVLIGLFSMNLFITYQLLGYWPLGQWVCDIWLSLDFSACLTSQYTVFLITLDRYCSVRIPASYRNWRTLVKVRWMICVSWLFPAGLFTPVIMGWKQLTSEPPRPEGKCDVSFTYYPIFNTTLIIGYFWTTLIVMCSLYVGIYQVARRLERKSQGTSEKLAALFKSFGAELTEAEHQHEDNTEHATQPSKIGMASSAGVNDSGFKEAPEDIFNNTGDLHRMEQNCTAPTVNAINAATPSELNFDNDSIYSPLKTTEEPFDLTKVKSPIENTQDLCGENNNSACKTSLGEIMFSIEGATQSNHVRPFPRPGSHKSDHPREPINLSFNTTQAVDKLRSNNNSATVLGKRINFEDEPFLYKCIYLCGDNNDTRDFAPQKEKEQEDIDSDVSDLSSSKEPIDVFVPSPTVPVFSASDSECSQMTKHLFPTQQEPNSPVWVENPKMKKADKDPYFCCECYQIAESSSSGYQCCDPLSRSYTVPEHYSIQCTSPYQLINFSDFSSSGQNESSDQFHSPYHQCYCQYQTGVLTAELITAMSTSADSSSTYCEQAPWYRRLWDLMRMRYQKEAPCPCTRPALRLENPSGHSQWLKRHSDISVRIRWQNLSRKMSIGLKSAAEVFRLGAHKRVDKAQESQESSDSKKSVDKQLDQKRRASLYRKRSMRPSWAQIRSMNSIDSQNRRHARKALRTISFILGAFMMCWIPYHIIMMIKGFCDDFETHGSCVSHHLYNLTYWLCYMNSPINPFCYALSNASFRRTFFRILKGNFNRK